MENKPPRKCLLSLNFRCFFAIFLFSKVFPHSKCVFVIKVFAYYLTFYFLDYLILICKSKNQLPQKVCGQGESNSYLLLGRQTIYH